MATSDGEDRSRMRVQTYVDASQREEWEQRAESMDMSLSEFVRTMTQAGKRGFEEAMSEGNGADAGRRPSSPPNPQGSGLEERVLSALSADEYRSWDDVVAAVQEDFEAELGDVVDELLDDGAIEHRHGRGYALA